MKREIKGGKKSFFIVGAGPAGLGLGILLRRKGYKTIIIDKEQGPHRPVCGEYLSPQGVGYMEKMGLSHLLSGFEPIWGMRLTAPSGSSVLARFPEKKRGAAIHRQELQLRLSALYLELGGELVFGEQILDAQEEGGGISIKTNARTYQCDALIGADGRLSQVAKIAGLEREADENPRVAIHCYLAPKRPLSHHGQMHILADGSYVGINPLHGREVNFSIVTNASTVNKFGGVKNLLNHYLENQTALKQQFHPITHEKIKTTFPISCHREKVAQGRIALIGDASGFIDPLTGEGITTALKTACLLAEKIETNPDLESAFSAYARARKTQYRQKEQLNLALQWVIKHPMVCEGIALLLRSSARLRSDFIGVIGNIYTPSQAVRNFLFSQPRQVKNGKDRISSNRVSSEPVLAEGNRRPAENRLA